MRAIVSLSILGSSFAAARFGQNKSNFLRKDSSVPRRKMLRVSQQQDEDTTGRFRWTAAMPFSAVAIAVRHCLGDPDASRVVQALSYKHELKMPPAGKLPISG